MVFLDKLDDNKPKYLACSAHHNFGSLVRDLWEELETENGHPIVYVAAGSHANYSDRKHKKNNGKHVTYWQNSTAMVVDLIPTLYKDKTDDTGEKVVWLEKRQIWNESPGWVDYQGRWGQTTGDVHVELFDHPYIYTKSPQFPKFHTDGKWANPVNWARLEPAIIYIESFNANSTPAVIIDNSDVKVLFQRSPGGKIVVERHDERPPYLGGVDLFPQYWNVDSDMEDHTFLADLTFHYNDLLLDTTSYAESTLSVAHFDENTGTWSLMDTQIDTYQNTLSVQTDQFSIFSIVFSESFLARPEPPSIISIDPLDGAIAVRWNPSSLLNIVSYKLYYGTASQAYEDPMFIGNVTSYTLTGLTNGTEYYISLTAYTNTGMESNHSPEITATSGVPPTLSDVTSLSQINKFSTRYDRRTGQFLMMATWTNTGDDSWSEPLEMVIENITPDTVTCANEDGTNEDEKPYYDYSELVGDGKLNSGETSAAKTLIFNNPSRVRFEFDISCRAVVNSSSGAAPSKMQQKRIHIVIPGVSALAQNYPNPFNPETWIPYELADAGDVKIRIYDIQGRIARTLDLGYREIGQYFSRDEAAYWDGRNAYGERVGSGIYFYQLQSSGKAVKKMVIVK